MKKNLKKELLYLISIIALAFLLVLVTKLEPFASLKWKALEFHSFVEGAGGVIAFIMGSILLINSKGKIGKEFLMALGFLSMGIFDCFHAIAPPGVEFVFLHSIAILTGGLFFALTSLSKFCKFLSSRSAVWFVVVFSVMIGILTFIFPQKIPTMLENNNFTVSALALNIIGGVFFLIGTIYLYSDYIRVGKRGDFQFVILSLLLALAGFTFKYSSIWDSGWWFWHLLRLIAYTIVLVWLIKYFVQSVKQMELLLIKQEVTEKQLNVVIRELTANGQQIETVNKLLKESNRQLIIKDEKINTERKKLLAILDASEDILYVSDPETYELVHVNTAFTKIWGDNVIGKLCYKVLQGRDEPCPFCTNDIIFGKKLGQTHFWEFQNEKTNYWFRCADRAIDWVDGRKVRIELATDITEIKQINLQLSANEEQLKKNYSEIQHINQKLEDYSYTISHDLKEPTRSIRTFSQFILEDYFELLDEDGKDYFNRIIKASTRMATMIEDLLYLSKIGREDIEFKNVCISNIIEELEDFLNQKIEENSVTINYPKLPKIVCQPVWIKAVFLNLFTNSINHNDKDKKTITITYNELPDFHEFSVEDNGNGIHKDQLGKVFGLFRKGNKNKTTGSGAGLAIISSIIEQHKGKIWFDNSEVGVGSVIKFWIKKIEGVKL